MYSRDYLQVEEPKPPTGVLRQMVCAPSSASLQTQQACNACSSRQH